MAYEINAGEMDPLTPSDSDLRDFPFIQLEIMRLRRSKAWLMAKRNPELGFYMMNLWTASWHDVPAASLEDDDDVLADLAMCDPHRWLEVRDQVLHGWVKCRDNRLYHPVVAEKAREAWQAKLARKERTEAARRAREERRAGKSLSNAPTDSVTDTVATCTYTPTDSVTDTVAANCRAPQRREGEGEGEGEREGEGDSIRQKEKDHLSPDGDQSAFALHQPDPPPPKIEDEAVEIWNSICGTVLPKVSKLSTPRRQKLLKRIKEDLGGDIEGWRRYCRRIVQAPFLVGESAAKWKADFDWAIEPRNTLKVQEGKYDPPPRPSPHEIYAFSPGSL